MADFNFGCTSCGRCCHDLRLPLTTGEAIDWLERGNGAVEVLCEAVPWLEEPDPPHAWAAYKRQRSFAAMSGDLPIRVIVTLTAVYQGACPNLAADFRCGIYAMRPRACRIYPAEVNPFIAFAPEHKRCPPEAWTAPAPFMRNGEVVECATQREISALREESRQQLQAMPALCDALGIAAAGLSNEGFAVHAPPADRLLEILRTLAPSDDGKPTASWTLVSNQAGSIDALASVGALSRWIASTPDGVGGYIGFRQDVGTQPISAGE